MGWAADKMPVFVARYVWHLKYKMINMYISSSDEPEPSWLEP